MGKKKAAKHSHIRQRRKRPEKRSSGAPPRDANADKTKHRGQRNAVNASFKDTSLETYAGVGTGPKAKHLSPPKPFLSRPTTKIYTSK